MLFTLTGRFSGLDMAEDGTMFVDQQNNTLQVLRINRSGGSAQRIAKAESYFLRSHTVELSDGRVIVPGIVSGRPRLMLTRTNKLATSLIDTAEETSGPITVVGGDQRCFPARKRTGEICGNRIAFGSAHHSQNFSTRCRFNRSVGVFSRRQNSLLCQRKHSMGNVVRTEVSRARLRPPTP